MKYLASLLLAAQFLLNSDCLAESEPAKPAPSAQPNKAELCANAQRMRVHAHRGANDRPQNTMAAFQRAVELGADVVELDLQATKDKKIIVAHDAFFRSEQCLDPRANKLSSDPTKRVFFGALDLAEVKKYDCGALPEGKAQTAPGERIVSLPELMAFLKDKPRLRLNIEIKYDKKYAQYYPALNDYVDLIIADVEKSGVEAKQFFFQSFQHETLRRIREKHPEWEISPLLGEVSKILEVPAKLQARMVTPTFGGLTQSQVGTLQKAGIQVVPWTANTEKDMHALVRLGVDGIITDEITLFQKVRRDLCGGH